MSGQINNKKKRDMIMLIVLGFIAITLLVLSIVLSPDDTKKNEKIPSTEETNIDNVEKDKNETKQDDESKEEDSLEQKGEEGNIETENDVQNENQTSNVSNKEVLKGSETYVNKKFNLSFDIPANWENVVSIAEEENEINFYYKDEIYMFGVVLIPNSEWERQENYHKDVHKTLFEVGDYRFIYGLPSEFPLAGKEGSADYEQLLAIMNEIENVIASAKFLGN